MYNFFVLESGDKWARTGTKFRPRNPKGLPSPSSGNSVNRPTREVSLSVILFNIFVGSLAQSTFEYVVKLK